MPCRKRRPKATTGGRALLYAPGTDGRVPAGDRAGRLSFGLGPRLCSTRGIAGRKVESRGRPAENRCCCNQPVDGVAELVLRQPNAKRFD